MLQIMPLQISIYCTVCVSKLCGCLSYFASDRKVTSLGLLRDERVPNRDQHDATEDFVSLDEVYYEDDGVQCTDFCYLKQGTLCGGISFLSSVTPAKIGFMVAVSVSHLNSILTRAL